MNHSLVYSIGQYCNMLINMRIVSQVKVECWNKIGYELIDNRGEVKKIEGSRDTDEMKCFMMLKTWLETDISPCYCKLFAALEKHNYYRIIIRIEELITSLTTV